MRFACFVAVILAVCVLLGSFGVLPLGAATTTIELEPTDAPPPPPFVPTARPTATPEPAGTGLRGDYYNGTNFNTRLFRRTDPQIAFQWGTRSPGAGVNRDKFSVRWAGYLKPPVDGTFRFIVTVDNGARVWVDKHLVIDSWGNRGPRTVAGTVNLRANQPVPITVEYQEYSGGAGITLSWSHPAFTEQRVPQSALYLTP